MMHLSRIEKEENLTKQKIYKILLLFCNVLNNQTTYIYMFIYKIYKCFHCKMFFRFNILKIYTENYSLKIYSYFGKSKF